MRIVEILIRSLPRILAAVTILLATIPGAAASEETMPVIEIERWWDTTDDPARDGWPSEAFYLRAKKQLARLAAALGPDGDIQAVADALATQDFRTGSLRPETSRVAFRSGDITTLRADEQVEPVVDSRTGPQGLAEALREVQAGFGKDADLSVAFKVVGVELGAGEVKTRQHVTIRAKTADGLAEQHATWLAHWTLPAEPEAPRLRRLEMQAFEETALRRATGPLFHDATVSVLGGNPSYARQLRWGFDHWAERIADWPRFENLAMPGVAIGDVNGDGRDDLYLAQQAGLPNRLFVQRPDGTALDRSTEAGVDWLNDTRGVLLLDLDNDGDQDLAVATIGGVALAENDGTGTFEVRKVLSTADDTMSLAAADFDLDGDLDLFVSVYFPNVSVGDERGAGFPAASTAFVFHDARSGGPNALWRNDGDWAFSDVTEASGLDLENHRYSFAAAWEDYDDDGDPDLYVANDYGPNQLWRNEGGRFTDVARDAGAEDSASGMSVTWADYDRDGDMDVYVSNMFSSAGRRVTQQASFKADSPEMREVLRRFARGNTLLRNEGDGTFSDVSIEAGVNRARWAWGSHFVDLDDDGWEDLVVANGYMTTDDTGDL